MTTGNPRLLLQIALLNALASLFLLLYFAAVGVDVPASAGCTEKFIDFHVFWSAGRLALAGTPLSAFDQEILRATYDGCGSGIWLPWLHPAPAMTLFTPFAVLPFTQAWLTFDLVSVALLGLALCAFQSPKTYLFWGVLLAPAMLAPLLAGQITVLWIAGLLGAIAAQRAERPVLAGICIGLLTLKPTLGLLIPVVLIAIWNLRAIWVAALTTVVIHGAATLLYGVAYWSSWRAASQAHMINTLTEMFERDNMSSIAAVLARVGLAPQMALTINLLLAACLAIIVFVTWRRFGAQSDISAAVLFSAIPLASPYLWHYDTAFTAVAAMFLLRSQTGKIELPYVLAMIALWFGSGFLIWNSVTVDFDWLIPIWTIPPLLILALGLSLGRVITHINTPQS